MLWLLLALTLLAVCFGGVLVVGAPYLPTLKPQVATALKLAKLRKGQHLLELGCGDGKVMVAAARQGIKVTGYELNPLLVVVAKLRCWRYRHLTTIIWGDFWRKEWPKAEAIFVFLLPKYMLKLDTKCIQYKHKPVKLVSFAFKVPERKPSQQERGVFLYRYR